MKVNGYKLNGYNATYEKTLFNVVQSGDMLEVTDINSGVTFLLELQEEKASIVRTWRSRNIKVKSGKHLHHKP